MAIFSNKAVRGVITEDFDMDQPTESFSPVESRYRFAVMPESISINQNNKSIEEGKRAWRSNRMMVYDEVKLPYYLFTAMVLCKCLTIVQRIKKHTSKIALRIGGHSPPVHFIHLVPTVDPAI